MVRGLVRSWVKAQAGTTDATAEWPANYQREMDKLLDELEATRRTLFEVIHERSLVVEA